MNNNSIFIPKKIIGEIILHSLENDPNESCGVLQGSGGIVSKFHSLKNIHENPQNRYTIDPVELLNAENNSDNSLANEFESIDSSELADDVVEGEIDTAESASNTTTTDDDGNNTHPPITMAIILILVILKEAMIMISRRHLMRLITWHMNNW